MDRRLEVGSFTYPERLSRLPPEGLECGFNVCLRPVVTSLAHAMILLLLTKPSLFRRPHPYTIQSWSGSTDGSVGQAYLQRVL